MTEEAMYDGLIRTIRYSDYEQKEELLSLLRFGYTGHGGVLCNMQRYKV